MIYCLQYVCCDDDTSHPGSTVRSTVDRVSWISVGIQQLLNHCFGPVFVLLFVGNSLGGLHISFIHLSSLSEEKLLIRSAVDPESISETLGIPPGWESSTGHLAGIH